MSNETELRHAVIDRLIAASLSDVVVSRELALKNWRAIGTKPTAPTPLKAAPAA